MQVYWIPHYPDFEFAKNIGNTFFLTSETDSPQYSE
jgi:hypothetical protein